MLGRNKLNQGLPNMAPSKASEAANAAAGRVGIWSARVLHAAIEGVAYVCTVPGALLCALLALWASSYLNLTVLSCQTVRYCESRTSVVGTRTQWACLATGFRTVLAVHGVAICYYLGPTRTASLTLRCALACAGYKFCETLIRSAPSGVCSRVCSTRQVPIVFHMVSTCFAVSRLSWCC